MTEQAQVSETQLIENGRQIGEMMESEAMKRLLASLEAQFVAEWRDGKNVEARERAHAKMEFLNDFRRGALIAQDAGKMATHARAQRENQEAKKTETRGNRGR